MKGIEREGIKKEGRRKERRKEGRKKGREGRKERRKEGRKEGRNSIWMAFCQWHRDGRDGRKLEPAEQDQMQ
tara:strand:+ start:148 stop:363 length:216 start_codon:yes stop_codon:yes gene_type:complete